ncbi:hypothetical protein GCM10008983_11670 [Lentibacillus halophilus]|uniref:Transposase (putative) YhgA-like domain-containing protein n=1 Tax=Lentibacillus halophilus TaxID=295065 RepID=A0ABN0Z7F4_9BACI
MKLATCVREESNTPAYIHHDHLFKELIHTFFEEFLQAFFPKVHEYIDFHTIKPLSEEVFSDMHEAEAKRLDIVMEVNEEEEASLMKDVKNSPDVEKIMDLPISFEEKGKEKGIKEVALAMISEGLSTAFIAKITQLDEDEIEKLRQDD